MVSLKRNTPSDLLPTDFTEADIQMVDKQPLYNGFSASPVTVFAIAYLLVG